MVNDREVRGFQFDKEKCEVIVTFANDMPMLSLYENRTVMIADVENVRYIGTQSHETYNYESSEIERVKVELEKEKCELSKTLDHFGFIRELLFIYQNAFDNIKNAVTRSSSKCEVSVIKAIIEQAEKAHVESDKRFDKVREKWDKKDGK